MISVCMATFNGEKFILEQVQSILKQLSDEDELIISDDGSIDNTKKIIEMICDKRIKWIENKGDHGFTKNFENALKESSGDYIFLADQDDIWISDKVEKCMKYLKQYDLVITDSITIDSNLNVTSISRFDDFQIKGTKIEHFFKSRYIGCCMCFNRRLLNMCLPFPNNSYLLEHDIWIAAVGFSYFKTFLLREPLLVYRRHGGNVSSGGFTKGYSFQIKVKKRIYRLVKLLQLGFRIQKKFFRW